jgi:hypothetical protein
MKTANNIVREDLEFTSCLVYLLVLRSNAIHLAKTIINPHNGNMAMCMTLAVKNGVVRAHGDMGDKTSNRFKLIKPNP